MATLATSFMTGRERNCTYSIVLDKRSNRTRTNEFPLSVRFTIDKKSIYLPIGGSYTPQYFSDVTNAKKSRSAKYTDQQQWAVIIEKYKMMNLVVSLIRKEGKEVFFILLRSLRISADIFFKILNINSDQSPLKLQPGIIKFLLGFACY